MHLDERAASVGLLAGGILLGLFAPPLTALLAPFALPALFFVILFSLIPFASLPNREFFRVDTTVWHMVGWQQIALPSIILALAIIARLPQHVTSLMLLTACAGSLFASPALAALLNLDARRALQCMVLSTLLMPISLYIFISGCLSVHAGNESHVHLNIAVYVHRVGLYLLLPFAIFGVYRVLAMLLPTAAHEHISAGSRWLSLFALLIFGIGIMDAVSHQIIVTPVKILFYLAISVTLSLGMLMFTAIVMNRYGFKEALTAGILAGFRNVGLGLALVGDMLGSELAPYVGISMLPVFIGPMLIRLMTASNPQLLSGRA